MECEYRDLYRKMFMLEFRKMRELCENSIAKEVYPPQHIFNFITCLRGGPFYKEDCANHLPIQTILKQMYKT